MGHGDSAPGSEARSERRTLEEAVLPSWLFVVRRPVFQVVLALVVPALVVVPFTGHSLPDARPGALFVLPIVAVAALAGWRAAALAGGITLATFWYYVIPPDNSFRLTSSGGVVSVISIAAAALAITLLMRRLEHAVDEARHLDAETRRAAEREAEARLSAESSATRMESLFWLSSALSGAETAKEMAEIVTAHLVEVGARYAALTLTTGDLEQLGTCGVPSEAAAKASTPLPRGMGVLVAQFDDPAGLARLRAHLDVAAEIVGVSIRRAQQQAELEANLAERDRIARTLSTSLLPPRLPAIPPFSISSWLEPAAGDEVAGDFFDVFPARDGGWVAVIGDVCGKGAEAAAVTSLARYAARTAALEGPAPARVIRVANEALLRDDSELYCTMAIVRYSPGDSSIEVAVAGHQHPRLLTAEGVHRLGVPGLPLGLFELEDVESTSRPIGPGDAIVLFTDGLVERDPAFDEAALDNLLATLRGQPADDISAVLRKTLHGLVPHRRDDVAVVVVGYDVATPADTA